MSDDGTQDPDAAAPDVTSFAAHWYAKAREQAARSPSVPPGLAADLAELGELSARLDTLAAGSDAATGPGRAERLRQQDKLLRRLAEIMTRVTEDPAEIAVWRQLAGTE